MSDQFKDTVYPLICQVLQGTIYVQYYTRATYATCMHRELPPHESETSLKYTVENESTANAIEKGI